MFKHNGMRKWEHKTNKENNKKCSQTSLIVTNYNLLQYSTNPAGVVLESDPGRILVTISPSQVDAPRTG